MALASKGSESADAGRLLRWEAVLELARRALSVPRRRPEPFRSAADVFERYRFLLSDSPVEVFVAVLLDVKHRPLREERVSAGSSTAASFTRGGVRPGGPGTRRGGPPAAQPPQRRSRPQRPGPGVTRRLRSAGGSSGSRWSTM